MVTFDKKDKKLA